MIQHYGLQVKPAQPDHWKMGEGKASRRFGAGDLKPDGDWSDFDPKKELQRRNGFETMNCSNFGTSNALLALAKFLKFDDFVKNSSERYTGVMTGTTPSGNDPHDVIEIIRTVSGLIEEDNLPWKDEDTWSEYYAPKPMDQERMNLGESLLRKFVIGQEWVITPGSGLTPTQKRERLQAALRRGTVAVSVRAWEKTGNVYTKQPGAQDTHWVWLPRYDKDGYPRIRDQYDPFDKKLAQDYDFGFAKVYFLKRNESGLAPSQQDYLSRLIKWATDAIKKLTDALLKTNTPVPVIEAPPVAPPSMPTPVIPNPPAPMPSNREKLYAKAKSLLGTSQVDKSVPISFGCASALNNVYTACFGRPIGGGASTAEMFKVLKSSPERFTEIAEKDVLPGDIVMNASGTSTKGNANGHVGIRGFTETMSNNSENGKWSAHYTNAAWKAFFEVQRGFKTRYFRVRG